MRQKLPGAAAMPIAAMAIEAPLHCAPAVHSYT
jgi:hypothetical protein